jgi:hypothetical protein
LEDLSSKRKEPISSSSSSSSSAIVVDPEDTQDTEKPPPSKKSRTASTKARMKLMHNRISAHHATIKAFIQSKMHMRTRHHFSVSA